MVKKLGCGKRDRPQPWEAVLRWDMRKEGEIGKLKGKLPVGSSTRISQPHPFIEGVTRKHNSIM